MSTDPELPKVTFGKRVSKIFLEIVAALLWIHLSCAAIGFDISDLVAPYVPTSLQPLWPFRFLAVLLILAILWLCLGNKAFFLSLAKVIGYPIVLIWRVVELSLKHWTTTVAFLPVITETAIRCQSHFVRAVFFLAASVVIFRTGDPPVICAAVALLLILLSYHLIRSLRRAYASKVFSQTASFVKSIRISLEKWITEDLEKTKERLLVSKNEGMANARTTTKKPLSKEDSIQSLYVIHSVFDHIHHRMEGFVKQQKVDLYLFAIWFWTLGFTILSYSLIHFGIAKADTDAYIPSFTGDYWPYLGFAADALFVGSWSEIRPHSTFANIVSYSAYFAGVTVFIILMFTLLTAARDKHRNDIDLIVGELEGITKFADAVLSTSFNLAIDEAERLLLATQPTVVNELRKLKGLAALPVPAASLPAPPQKGPRTQPTKQRTQRPRRRP